MTILRRFLELSLSLGGIAVWMFAGLGWLYLFGPTTEIAYDIDLAGTPALSVASTVCGVEKPGRIVTGRARGEREVRCEAGMSSSIRYAGYVVVCDLGDLSPVPFGGRIDAKYRIVGRSCDYVPDEAALWRSETAG